jgi:tetratricopeptide (TPR) repeat protein
VAIDREDSLRRAEKLLRQGRLDGAIEEYVRLLEEQSQDWNTRNALGDLYVRAGKVELAATQYLQIADHFAAEGFLAKALALYRKAVKIRPDDEHALLQSAEINAKQGLLAEAKHCLAAVADQRRRRDDRAGANEILIRIATLDPSDLAARMSAARASAEMGDTSGAAERYKALAKELFERDRASEAIDALAEAVHLDSADAPARDSLVAAYLERGEMDEARRYATTGAHFKALAEDLSARGQEEEALEALAEALQRDPADIATRARLGRSFMESGQVERAAACLTPETVGDEPDLLILAAEVNLRTGRRDAGRELLRSVVTRDPLRREDLVALGCNLAETDRDVAFDCVEVATDAAITARDWPGAAEGLQAFSRVAPSHIPALIKLVDVCVDGDLEAPLMAAQAELAECYLAAGRAFEARVIAEDLVSRAPGDSVNVDRFRRALVMVGEADPDAIIADRLNFDSSMAAEDLNLDEPPAPAAELESVQGKVLPFARAVDAPEPAPAQAVVAEPVVAEAPAVWAASSTSPLLATAPREQPAEAPPAREAHRQPAAEPERAPAAQAAVEPRSSRKTEATAAEKSRAVAHAAAYDLSSGSIDAGAILAGNKTENRPPAGREFEEIDLSSVLGDMKAMQSPVKPEPRAAPAPAPPAGPAAPGRELGEVFEEFRQEVQREQATTTAAKQYKLALTYHDMGMIEECIKALEISARSPRYRFQSAILLGRIHRHEGKTHEAIDWFERAAETPASSAEAGRALLYELGQALEDAAESVRALAVYLEIQADAGDYRDVRARIQRLSR